MKSTSRLSLLLLAMSLVVAGCIIPADERGPGPAPDPSPESTAVEKAYTQFVVDFAEARAVEADVTADKAASYRSWDEATADWAARNKAAQDAAFKPVATELDKATGSDDAPYDADSLARVAREAARGLRRGKGAGK